MTITIIKAGTPRESVTYEASCDRCGCVFRYAASDVRADRDGPYVPCPTCETVFIRHAQRSPARPGACSYCGQPANSASCQRSHP